jgi:hypothetical protein
VPAIITKIMARSTRRSRLFLLLTADRKTMFNTEDRSASTPHHSA